MRFFKNLKVSYIWLKLSYQFRFSHHPICDKYSNQLINVGSVHLCQGCTIVTVGGVIGAVAGMLGGILLESSMPRFIIPAVVIQSIMAPVFIIDYLQLGRKWKRVARACIGTAIGLGFSLAFFVGWLLKLTIVLLIFLNFQLYRIFRTKSPSIDLCPTCEFFPDKPNCPGFEQQFAANKVYMQRATEILYDSFEARFSQLSQNMEGDLEH